MRTTHVDAKNRPGPDMFSVSTWLFLSFSLLSLAHLDPFPFHMPDELPKMNSTFAWERMLCIFGCMLYVDVHHCCYMTS
jgi:hypothetical protein